MALPASGPISTADIATEFFGGGGFTMPNDLYRGGAYVPDILQNAAVPTSGNMVAPNNLWNARA